MSAPDVRPPQARRCPPATSARTGHAPPAGAGFGLTAKQLKILRFIDAYQQLTGGVSPSSLEIAYMLGMRSKSGVVYDLQCLVDRGHIRRLTNRARAIEVLRPDAVPAPTLGGVPLQFVPVNHGRP